MLQYPINVYPDKVAFDSTKATYDRDLHFTFKGDLLTCVFYKIYNYDTQQIVRSGTHKDLSLSPLAYNNDEVNCGAILTDLPQGRYVIQMMLTQTQKNLVNIGYYDVYDRYVSRGKLKADYTSGDTTMKIENKINLIYEWNKNGNTYSHTEEEMPITPSVSQTVYTSGIIIAINGDVALIDSYDYETGEITLKEDTAFSENLSSGTEYALYSNYLITEQYYFEVCEEPQIQALSRDNGTDIWVTWDSRGGDFKAFYWKGLDLGVRKNNLLKYYTINLNKKSSSSVWYDILTTDKIYSQNIDWRFSDDYDPIELDGGNCETRTYKITLTCVMQNGMSFIKEYEVVAPQRSATEIITDFAITYDDDRFNRIQMQWGTPRSLYLAYRIYRLNAEGRYNTGTHQDKFSLAYANNPYKVLIGDESSGSGFDDYFPSADGNYQYLIVPYNWQRDATEIYAAYLTDVVNHKFKGYTLTACYDTGKNADGKMVYKIGDTWKFMCDIDDTDNQQNLNRQMHIGNGKYSTATKTDNNFMTGKLSGYIGYMNCSSKEFEDDIEVVKAWRRFLAQDAIYVLRSPKGDVWLVNIVDNAVTKYEESTPRIPVQFTFSWAECGNIEDYLIVDSMPPFVEDRR